MKKILFLFGSIIFGYFGIVFIAMTINSATSEKFSSGELTMLGVLGATGILLMRFFWKKFREPKNKELN